MKKSAYYVLAVLAPVALGIGVMTAPTADDVIDIGSVRVVGLSSPYRNPDSGCWTGEETALHAGDQAFVAAGITFLVPLRERYRTHLRNVTIGRNAFDTDWSAEFEIPAGSAYCDYHRLEWWVGRETIPPLAPGSHRLTTEYELVMPGAIDRQVSVTVHSEVFEVEAPDD